MSSRLTIDCPSEQKKKIKMLAAAKEMSITDFMLQLFEEKYGYWFNFVQRSVWRNAPDVVAGDEGIASAIAEEPDATDGVLQPTDLCTKLNQ